MSEEKALKSLSSEYGTINIVDEVVATTAGLAATEVDGVASMSGGVVEGIAQRLGKKNLSRGIKVDVSEEEASIDVYVIIKYGVNVPGVCGAIQSQVKKAVESTLGLRVSAVNIHVQGLSFTEEGEVSKEAEE